MSGEDVEALPVRDPATRISGLLAEGRVEEADAALSRIGHAARHAEGLLALRAVTAARLGRHAEALASAWAAAERSPREGSLQVLVARLLEAGGAAELAFARHALAAERDPEDRRTQAAFLARTARKDPARARERLPALLRLLGPEEAADVAPLARALGLSVWGACRREGRRIRLWTAGPAAARAGLSVRVAGLDGPLPATPAFRRAAAPEGVAAFEADWPEEAATVHLGWGDGTPLAGSPLHAPVAGPEPPQGPPPPISGTVDVILPVHGGYAETLACLASLLRARSEIPHEIVVVNDATPDDRLAGHLRRLARTGRIRLVTHAANRGFTAAANHGLSLHPDRDAVLLNADTVVPDFWLDRLVAAARREPDAGTVTPFTNNGQLVSLPRPYHANPMPDRETLARIDAAAAAGNAGQAPDIPVGAGFCMLIRRACLAEVGPLDERVFSRGYGEETDFCLRAARYGWRNLCAADLFVAHHGAQSFGAEKAALVKRNMAAIERRHPVYRPLMDAFDADDPLAAPRRAIERRLLDPLGEGGVLAVGPPDWRRSPLLAPARALVDEGGRSAVWLRPVPTAGPGVVAIEGAGRDGPANLRYRLPDEREILLEDIARLAPRRMLLAGLDQPVPLLRVLRRLDLPMQVHVSDGWLPEALAGDLPEDEAVALAAHLVDRAARVIAPSRFAAARLKPFAGDRVALARPPLPTLPDDWPPPAAVPEGALHVAVVSGAETAEGQATLHAIATLAARPPRLFVLGEALDAVALARTGRVHVPGRVAEEERAALAAALGAGVALVLAPETEPTGLAFDAAAATCPRVVAVGGGALYERAAGHRQARVLPSDTPAEVLARALREAAT